MESKVNKKNGERRDSGHTLLATSGVGPRARSFRAKEAAVL